MSEQPGANPPREDNETTLFAGVPGPSGTGTQTDAGADPAAGAIPQSAPDKDRR